MVTSRNRVADCAGGKLCMIGDMLMGKGSATGVDISQERCSACRNILRKYAVPGCRLFRGDATTFTFPPPDAAKAQVLITTAVPRVCFRVNRYILFD